MALSRSWRRTGALVCWVTASHKIVSPVGRRIAFCYQNFRGWRGSMGRVEYNHVIIDTECTTTTTSIRQTMRNTLLLMLSMLARNYPGSIHELSNAS
jgi:hypothetical protein